MAVSGQDDSPPQTERILELRVIHKETGEPLPGVTVETEDIDENRTPVGSTDAQGQLKVRPPGEPSDVFKIAAHKRGLTPVSVWWGAGKEMTGQFTLSMEPATTIGGVVVDEKGQPIEDAEITILSFSMMGQQGSDLGHYPARSDEHGKWVCKNSPAELASAWFIVSHPDFLDERTSWFSSLPIDQLRQGTARVILRKGTSIAGVVRDADGKPIAGAEVFAGEYRFRGLASVAQADEQGRFRSTHVAPGRVVLTATAKGFAPALHKVHAGSETGLVEFRLKPSRPLRGRVVDKEGRPIPGALIEAGEWQGHRPLEWQANSDGRGRFEWTDAPAESIELRVLKRGYRTVNAELASSAEEHVIELGPATRIRGRVVDAETGQPIPRFTLWPGFRFSEEGDVHWSWWAAEDHTQGEYETTTDLGWPMPEDEDRRYFVRIDAEGYRGVVSPPFEGGPAEHVFDVKLEKGMGASGVVLLPDGEPAEGAEVVLAAESRRVAVRNGSVAYGWARPPKVRTAADGKFVLPYEPEQFHLLALHERGFASVRGRNSASGLRLTLKPWGRVEGKAFIGRQPAAGQRIALWKYGSDEDVAIEFKNSATIDPQGRFAFDLVKPGQASVGRVSLGEESWREDYDVDVTVYVEPGKTTNVDVGGSGRPVVGRLTVDEKLKEQVDWRSCEAKLTRPAELVSTRQRGGWVSRLFGAESKTEHRYRDGFVYQLAVALERNGSFRIEDVPAGDYTLQVSLRGKPGDTEWGSGEHLGSASPAVTVPEFTGERTDEPFDLGEVQLEIEAEPVFADEPAGPPQLPIGEPVPGFEIETLDGKPLKLADYRGKVVLIDFWATWCGPCVAQIPAMKKLYEEFGGSDHFEIISLSLDNQAGTVRKFVEKREMKWVQGFLGDWSETSLSDKYQVTGIPTTFLVDHQGKLIGIDLEGRELKAAVKKAIEAASTAKK